MATTTNKKGTEVLGDFTEGFGDVSERYRVVNEKLIESGKKTGNAVLDGTEQRVLLLRFGADLTRSSTATRRRLLATSTSGSRSRKPPSSTG